MYLIFAITFSFLVFAAAATVNAIGLNWAAQYTQANNPNDDNVFKFTFATYLTAFVLTIIGAGFGYGATSSGIIMLLCAAALTGILIKTLAIKGQNNITIFIVVSVVLILILRLIMGIFLRIFIGY